MCILDPRLTDVQLVATLLRTAAALMHLEVWVHVTEHISHRVESHLKARNWEILIFFHLDIPALLMSAWQNYSMCFLYWYLPQESLKKHSEILGFSVVFGLDHRWTQWGDVTHLDGAGLPPGEVSPSENEVHGWVLVNLWTWYKLLPKLSSWICRGDRARKFLGFFCSLLNGFLDLVQSKIQEPYHTCKKIHILEIQASN